VPQQQGLVQVSLLHALHDGVELVVAVLERLLDVVAEASEDARASAVAELHDDVLLRLSQLLGGDL
jgi:hypothetical protein